MARILHRTINRYSGPVIFGQETVAPPGLPISELHLERAYWLTGQVETGNRMGSVMMADGTGFTIGRDQHIAVYPRELAREDFRAEDDQGGAWELLADIEKAPGAPVAPLWEAFAKEGWYVAPDGSLRWLEDGHGWVAGRRVPHSAGDLVHGAAIRDTITPVKGVVAKGGDHWETSRRWAMLLHELTADESTWATQSAFGLKHLSRRIETRKLHLHKHRRSATLRQVVYGLKTVNAIESRELGDELDLALCVFHSYTVNAPAIAFRLLSRALSSTGWNPTGLRSATAVSFARDLLLRLKTKEYGRWDQRWKRTRMAAKKVGWWPQELFSRGAVMAP